MSSEVDDSICVKAIAGPQIRGDISVGGSHISAMNYLEIIVSKSGRCLRNEYNISELKSRKGEIAVLGLEPMTGKLSVDSSYLFRHFFTKVFSDPFFIIRALYNLRVSLVDKIRHCPYSVISKYSTMVIDQFLKLSE